VRLPGGSLVQTQWQLGNPPVWVLLEYLARLLKLSPEELIEGYALVDRSSVPPTEVRVLGGGSG